MENNDVFVSVKIVDMLVSDGDNKFMESIIIVDALSIRYGGGLVLLSNLLEKLSSRDIEIVVIVNSRDRLQDKLLGWAGVTIKVVNNTASAFGATCFRRYKLNNYLNSFSKRLTVLTINSNSTAKFQQITLHINTIPFLPFSKRRQMVGFLRAILMKRSSLLAVRNSCLNVFESDYLLDLAKEACNSSIHNGATRYFGTDMKRVEYGELPKYQDRCNRLITITSAAEHKNNAETIKVFKKLRERYQDLELLVIGNENLIKRQLCSVDPAFKEVEGVNYAGYVSREMLFELLSKSKFLISMSSTESFYLVAIEAMFCGTPVILKEIPAAEESCEGHAHLTDTLEDVVNAYIELANIDRWSARSKAAYEYSERYTSEKCMKIISADIVKVVCR